jgi:hypothetical protein
LTDVVTLIAEDAGISYICRLGSQQIGENLVTFSLGDMSAFRSLEHLSRYFALTMIYDDGVWVIGADELLMSMAASAEQKELNDDGNSDQSRAETLSFFGLGDFKRDTSRLDGVDLGNGIVVSKDAVLFSKRKFDVEPKRIELREIDSLTLDAPVESLSEELLEFEPKKR